MGVKQLFGAQGGAGRVGLGLSVLVLLFLWLDAGMKIASAKVSVDFSGQLGFAPAQVPVLGWLLLISSLLYAVPRTSLIGAILLTGYLGGAIAVQYQHGMPLLSHVLFGAYMAAFAWGGLALRYPALMAWLLGRNLSEAE